MKAMLDKFLSKPLNHAEYSAVQHMLSRHSPLHVEVLKEMQAGRDPVATLVGKENSRARVEAARETALSLARRIQSYEKGGLREAFASGKSEYAIPGVDPSEFAPPKRQPPEQKNAVPQPPVQSIPVIASVASVLQNSKVEDARIDTPKNKVVTETKPTAALPLARVVAAVVKQQTEKPVEAPRAPAARPRAPRKPRVFRAGVITGGRQYAKQKFLRYSVLVARFTRGGVFDEHALQVHLGGELGNRNAVRRYASLQRSRAAHGLPLPHGVTREQMTVFLNNFPVIEPPPTWRGILVESIKRNARLLAELSAADARKGVRGGNGVLTDASLRGVPHYDSLKRTLRALRKYEEELQRRGKRNSGARKPREAREARGAREELEEPPLTRAEVKRTLALFHFRNPLNDALTVLRETSKRINASRKEGESLRLVDWTHLPRQRAEILGGVYHGKIPATAAVRAEVRRLSRFPTRRGKRNKPPILPSTISRALALLRAAHTRKNVGAKPSSRKIPVEPRDLTKHAVRVLSGISSGEISASKSAVSEIGEKMVFGKVASPQTILNALNALRDAHSTLNERVTGKPKKVEPRSLPKHVTRHLRRIQLGEATATKSVVEEVNRKFVPPSRRR